MDIFNNDQEIRRVLMQLINGYMRLADNPELFRDIYNSLLNTRAAIRWTPTRHPGRISVPHAEAHAKVDLRHTGMMRSGGPRQPSSMWLTAVSLYPTGPLRSM